MPALFTNPKASFPDDLGSNSELAAYRALHLLRSFLPLTNPFAADASCPPPTADALLGFFPSRVFSAHNLESLTRTSPKSSRTTFARRLQRATQGTLQPLESGEASPNTEITG
jgi:hypothetical protein